MSYFSEVREREIQQCAVTRRYLYVSTCNPANRWTHNIILICNVVQLYIHHAFTRQMVNRVILILYH